MIKKNNGQKPIQSIKEKKCLVGFYKIRLNKRFRTVKMVKSTGTVKFLANLFKYWKNQFDISQIVSLNTHIWTM